jgi:hypothetical protein
MFEFIKRLRNIKSIEFTLRRTGDKVPTWMILFIGCSFIFACIGLIWQLILGAGQIIDYLQNKSHNKKRQTYWLNVSPKKLSRP